MKNKASTFLKQVVSAVFTILKAKSMAVKNRTAGLKTKLMILSLLRNKKVLMTTISHKMQALMSSQRSYSMAIVSRTAAEQDRRPASTGEDVLEFVYNAEYDEYQDLTHSLFELDDDEEQEEDNDELADQSSGSVIDHFVRNSHEEINGSEFNLENEIDHAADMFIRRFHRQMRLQKLDSFKRQQEKEEPWS